MTRGALLRLRLAVLDLFDAAIEETPCGTCDGSRRVPHKIAGTVPCPECSGGPYLTRLHGRADAGEGPTMTYSALGDLSKEEMRFRQYYSVERAFRAGFALAWRRLGGRLGGCAVPPPQPAPCGGDGCEGCPGCLREPDGPDEQPAPERDAPASRCEVCSGDGTIVVRGDGRTWSAPCPACHPDDEHRSCVEQLTDHYAYLRDGSKILVGDDGRLTHRDLDERDAPADFLRCGCECPACRAARLVETNAAVSLEDVDAPAPCSQCGATEPDAHRMGCTETDALPPAAPQGERDEIREIGEAAITYWLCDDDWPPHSSPTWHALTKMLSDYVDRRGGTVQARAGRGGTK
jgi:hypothetical protein